MEEIKARIQQTVKSLSEKKLLLEKHKKQYTELKFKLFDYEQTNGQPELTVQLTSKARVKAQVPNPKQILVFLGCEYFVERDPKEAVKVVENKLKYLQLAIDEFDVKVKDAKKTLENIDTLVKHQKEEDNKKVESKSVQLNEESLPFMEIREELDEDGNVISGKVQEQNQDHLKEFGAKHGVELVDDQDELNMLLKDMGVMPTHKKIVTPKIEEIVEPEKKKKSKKKNKKKKKAQKKESNEDPEKDTERTLEDTILEREVTPPVQKEEEDFYSLFKEMGIVNRSSIKPTTPEPTKASTSTSTPTTFNATEIHDPENILSQLDRFDPSLPAIESDDIMQLQLIADEIEEDEEEDFDEDYDYGDDDDDEEDSDWEFDYEENMVPDTYRELFAKELERIRGTRKEDNEENIKEVEAPKKEKKSVSFAPELQIKEIENVSEQLKEVENSQLKVSKFKQMKQRKGNSNSSRDIEDKEDDVPLNDIVEKEISDNTVVSDIMERDIPEVAQPQTKKVSKFRSSMSSLNPAKAKASTIVESERVPIRQKVETPAPTQRLSKFKTSRSVEPMETNTPVSVAVPVNTYEHTQDEYNNIKAYALNDDDDEDLLNSITENMVVFNPDEDDDEQRDSDDSLDEESEDDGPMMRDEIVENDDVDEPSYFVDDNIIAKEYHDLRKKMIETYGEKQREAEERIILKEEEGQELEPIDEFGNPVKVSRFRKGMTKA